MENSILSNINPIIQNQIDKNITENIDLSDKGFSDILDKELDKFDKQKIFQEQLIEHLGVPIGMNIEGFDYNEKFDSTEKITELNTDSNIQNNDTPDKRSFLNNVKETFSPVIDSVLNTSFDLNSENINLTKTMKNFLHHQATNVYSVMDKENINDLESLVAKL